MRIVLILLALASLVFSCKKSGNPCVGPDLDCSTIRCIAHWDNFDFRLIDKATGTDLVFGTNPKYTTNDIKLYYDVGRTTPIQFQLDNNSKTIKVITARQEMYIEIKGTDVYKLTTEFRAETCCSSRVKTLWQDGQMVCACCSDAISLSIR